MQISDERCLELLQSPAALKLFAVLEKLYRDNPWDADAAQAFKEIMECYEQVPQGVVHYFKSKKQEEREDSSKSS